MIKKTAVLIDGGFLRRLAQQARLQYDAQFVEDFAHGCSPCGRPGKEEIYRILYYDCAPLNQTVTLPVSRRKHDYKDPDTLLRELAAKELFAIRRGELKFRGFQLRKPPDPGSGQVLQDADFKPHLEQKGVDLRLGLDVATLTANRSVDRIALLTNDTDLIPAMKHARRGGVQVALIVPEGVSHRPAASLLEHSDFVSTAALRPRAS